MFESQARTQHQTIAPDKRTLALAILAPFGAIVLLASPLIFDAVKHAAGF
jgi:hypothetical protein